MSLESGRSEVEQGSLLKGGISSVVEGVKQNLALLGISVALASSPVGGVKVAQAQTASPYTISDYKIPEIDFDSINLGDEQFNGLPKGKQDVAALQRFLHVEPANGNFGPKTRQALVDYKTRMGLGVTPEVDEKTYKKIAEDMVRLQLDMAMESFNDKPVAKFAIAYLLSKSLGIRLEGRYGKDIEQILGTVGLKVNKDLLLKGTIGYLLRGDNYRFDGVNNEVYQKIGQFVAGVEAKYSGFSKESFIQEVGGGIVMFDVKGKNLGSLGNIIEGGEVIGDRYGAITGGQREQGFVSTALRVSGNVKLELVGGYFQARETNPLDRTSTRTQGLYGDVKGIFRVTPQLQLFGKIGGEKGMLSYGGGVDLATGSAGVLSAEYQRVEIEERKPDNRYMLKFSIPLGGNTGPKANELPPLFDEKGEAVASRDIPKDIRYAGVVTNVKQPAEGITFTDLNGVEGTGITHFAVGGNPVTKEKTRDINKAPNAQNFTVDLKGGSLYFFDLLPLVGDDKTPSNQIKIKIVGTPTTNKGPATVNFNRTDNGSLIKDGEIFPANVKVVLSGNPGDDFQYIQFQYVAVDAEGKESAVRTIKALNFKYN